MNILYARMQGYDWVSTPSDAVARELEMLGHNVTIIETLDDVPAKKFDFVWAPYETALFVGEAAAQKLCIPLVSHLETIPPWRIKRNIDFFNYGLTENDPEISQQQLNYTIPYYERVGKAWKNAAIKTLSNHSRIDYHKKLLNITEDIPLRYPSIDVTSINKAKNMYSPKHIENRILTVSRATSIKRYDLLIQVMNQVQTKVTWAIIGDGPMLEVIKQKVTNPNVTLEIMGSKWGWSRYYEMMRSKLFVFAMGAMPPIEAALLGSFPIVIENQPTDDLPDFDKFMRYNFAFNKDDYKTTFFPIFQHNQIEEMAETIDAEIIKPVGQSLAENKTIEAFMRGDTNVTPSSVNAKQIIDRVKEIGI